jgi:hypothetical protein
MNGFEKLEAERHMRREWNRHVSSSNSGEVAELGLEQMLAKKIYKR